MIISGLAILLIGACTSQFVPTPTPQGKIIVRQSGGMGMLIAECGDKNYISSTADHIVEGTVVQVESRWDEDRTQIFTYADLSIEKHIKGTPFSENTIQNQTYHLHTSNRPFRRDTRPVYFRLCQAWRCPATPRTGSIVFCLQSCSLSEGEGCFYRFSLELRLRRV